MRRLAAELGMEETMVHLLIKQHLQWLGHLAHMESSGIPKNVLLSDLQKKRPCHGTNRGWCNVAASDVRAVIDDDSWYDLAQDRRAWRATCHDGISFLVKEPPPGWPHGKILGNATPPYTCQCGQSFCQKGDHTKHKLFCEHQT